jgi:hypothetical protein
MCLLVTFFVAALTCNAQSADPNSDSTPDARDDTTSKTNAPLTEHEREMLQLIKSLQDRVAKLEAQAANGSKAPETTGSAATSAASPKPTIGENLAANANPAEGSISAVGTRPTRPGSDGAAARPQSGSTEPGQEEPLMWGEYNSGRGYKVASSEYGDLILSGYMAARYLNQLPPDQHAVDHLGRPIVVQPRKTFSSTASCYTPVGGFSTLSSGITLSSGP